MRNISIKARLVLAAFAAVLAIIVSGGFGYLGMTQSNHGLDKSITATSAVLYQQRADMFHDALRADVLYALKAKAEGKVELQQQIIAISKEHAAEFRDLMARLDALPLEAAERLAVERVGPTVELYLDSATQLVSDAAGDKALYPLAFDVFMQNFSKLEEALGELGNQIEAFGNSAGQAAKDINAHILTLNTAISVVSALVLMGLLALIARSITRALDQAKAAIADIANGDLDSVALAKDGALKARDEVGAISRALNVLRERLSETRALELEGEKMRAEQVEVVRTLSLGLERLALGNLKVAISEPLPETYEILRANYNKTLAGLNDTLMQVVEASGKIHACSSDIGRSSDDLARRTENAAAALEETSAALSELTSGVRSAATDARKVETIVQIAKKEAEESGQIVSGAVEAMSGIERSSAQISQIIGVIDDIAFQTNLLALNAGVEAARAGDAGKGFAVVASEVRALAQRSSEASKEIKTLIKSSSSYVGLGVQAVGRAGSALATMVNQVTNISELMTGIATGAGTQSASLSEVNTALNELGQVAQQNAAMVSGTQASAEELNAAAIGLEQLVARFHIDHPMQTNRYAA